MNKSILYIATISVFMVLSITTIVGILTHSIPNFQTGLLLFLVLTFYLLIDYQAFKMKKMKKARC